MKNNDFINANIGNTVYLTNSGDAMCGKITQLILNKTPLTLIKLTRGGMAYLRDDHGTYYSVPPRIVREFETFL